MFEVDSRLRYFKPHAARIQMTFAQEIAASLGRKQHFRFISPKFFYDTAGSELFEEICSVPEYYLTRTEVTLLERVGDNLGSILARVAGIGSGGDADADADVTAACSPLNFNAPVRLVELGSGSSVKTRIILDALFKMQGDTEYFPIDISDILTQSSEQLLCDYPRLKITGIIDTYEGGLEFLREYDSGRNLIVFLGSSYGNLSPADGTEFLRKICKSMKPGDTFLMGLDMVKDAQTLESAYNDDAGVTSRFNLNVLSRINSELGANFDLDCFEHKARYNERQQRVEMYLESMRDQNVHISKPGLDLHLERGELIHTENSHKYRQEQIRDMLYSAGFEMVDAWVDDDLYFTLVIATVSSAIR